jgi:predicted dehydrogenase
MFYGIRSPDAANIRNRAETGGGVLRDLGVYPIVCGRFMFEAEPRRVIALLERDPAFGVERLASALLDFGAGRRLSFTVCSDAAPSQRTRIFGTLARLEIEITVNAPADREMRLVIDDGSAAEIVTVPAADQYELQVSAFARAVRGLAPLPYGLEDAIANMRVLDALLRSEASGRWEEP